jgi:thymidine kinase
MAKLYFHYSTMNAGKSTALLQASHNYNERGLHTLLLTAELDDRSGSTGVITSRIGLQKPAHTYNTATDVFALAAQEHSNTAIACVFIEEAQWLTKDQVWQLATVVDELNIPVMCYGLRVDFTGNLFSGSQALLAIADELREIRTICHCGKKATMVIRKDASGNAIISGPQTLVGGNETYESLCRKHFTIAVHT